jgi:homoserine kinase type II
MASVFVLQHVHSLDDGAEDVKFIGVYSSREKAQEAVARLAGLPGFADAPDGFHIDEYRLDQDNWAEGYVTAAGV